MNNLKKILKNSVLLLASILFTLLCLEAAVRIFAPQTVEKYINLFVSDGTYGWRLKPDSHGIFTSPEFKVEITANANGFRDIAHNFKKPEDTFRIAGIGDSFLFGTSTNTTENVLNYLKKQLAESEGSSNKVETMNFGMIGYNINQYFRILQNEASKYSPDLVIVFFYANDWNNVDKFDFSGANKQGYLLTGDNFSLSSARSFLTPVRKFLKFHSQLYIFVRGRILTLLRSRHLMFVPGLDLYKKDDNFGNKYSHTLQKIQEMNNICKQRIQCNFILCIIPEKTQVNKTFRNVLIKANHVDPNDYNWSQPQETLKNFCIMNNIRFIDLLPAFTALELKGRYYFDIDDHWNKKGHSAAADQLSAYIKNNAIMINQE